MDENLDSTPVAQKVHVMVDLKGLKKVLKTAAKLAAK